MIHDHIGRIDDEVVRQQAEHRHQNRTEQRADRRAADRAVPAVDQTGRKHKGRADDEVRKLADAAGHRLRQVDEVLHEANRHAAHGPERERGEQRRKLGKVERDEARHERQLEADEHQHGGRRSQNRRHRDLAGVHMGTLYSFCRHNTQTFL